MPTHLHQDASRSIYLHRLEVTEAMVAQQLARHPEMDERIRLKRVLDANYHLDYLAESLAATEPRLFFDYLAWARIMLIGRGVPIGDLALNMECLCDALRQTLPQTMADVAVEYIALGLGRLSEAPPAVPTFIPADSQQFPLASDYLAALLAGERQRASRLVMDAVEGGTSVQDIYLQVFQPCQHEIGRLWQLNQISVAQEHYCTAATQLIMSQLYPYLFTGERVGRTMVATCIANDLHEIGVRMVSDLFELSGWDTFYLGANTPVPSILEAVREQRADVLAVSATITPHLKLVRELIADVRAAPDCGAVKILVGGYPFRIGPDLWQRLGADGCAQDAATAVELANRLVSDGESI